MRVWEDVLSGGPTWNSVRADVAGRDEGRLRRCRRSAPRSDPAGTRLRPGEGPRDRRRRPTATSRSRSHHSRPRRSGTTSSTSEALPMPMLVEVACVRCPTASAPAWKLAGQHRFRQRVRVHRTTAAPAVRTAGSGTG
ncbi:hypothetical protein HBB16_14430 [Pseudonocardia sp. MCCB 268]|nr:hypothetical protein [Pseudonocardia cytotoxica]